MTALSTLNRHLCCIGGVPGAGKSTVGAHLAAVHGVATVVDLDSVTTALVEATAKQFDVPFDLDLPPLRNLRSARYQCLAQVAADNLKAGGNVIAIAPFSIEAADAGLWRDWCRSLGAEKIDLCWLDVDPAEALRRIAKRKASRDQLKTVDEADGDRTIVPTPVDRAAIDLVVDVSNRSVGEVVAELALHLGWKPSGNTIPRVSDAGSPPAHRASGPM